APAIAGMPYRGVLAYFHLWVALSPPVHDFLRLISSHMQSAPLCSCYEQGRVPLCLAAASWIGGFAITLVTILFMANLTFCSPNEIDNFFCDFTPLLKLACSDTYLFEKLSFFLSSTLMLVPFLLTVLSYIYILSAILNCFSTAGPQKTIFHFQFLDLSMTHYVTLDISHNLSRTQPLTPSLPLNQWSPNWGACTPGAARDDPRWCVAAGALLDGTPPFLFFGSSSAHVHRLPQVFRSSSGGGASAAGLPVFTLG
ncbi:unnamed protein product, partial [Natator depressus]